MATGICYTWSGDKKKYDGNVIPAVANGDKSYNPGYNNIKHDTSSVPGEDHYSFDDPSSYTLVEKGSSTRDDCPLIIVTYYPVAPANPCYFNYNYKKNKKFKIFINHTSGISFIGISSGYGTRFYEFNPMTTHEFTFYINYEEGLNDPYGVIGSMNINVYIYKENDKYKYPQKSGALYQYISNNNIELRKIIYYNDINDNERIDICNQVLIIKDSGIVNYFNPSFYWDPSYNIIRIPFGCNLKDKIYYNDTLIKEGTTSHYGYGSDLSYSNGYIRFHFYIDGVLQSTQINKNLVTFSKSVVKKGNPYGYKESADDGIHADRHYEYDNGKYAVQDLNALNSFWCKN